MLLASQSRPKECADHKVRDMTFQVFDNVRLVSYRLDLPHNLSGVHPVFHVSMMKRYHGDGDYIIKWDLILLDKDLQYEDESVVILVRTVTQKADKNESTQYKRQIAGMVLALTK
ncbi:hypothetical protein MTR67_043246, partial [Solanum verrucosum]